MMADFVDFADFAVFADLYNDTGEKWEADGDTDDALKDYYDAYCSYLVSRKYNTETIKTYRKNAIIDFYMTEKKLDNSFRNELDAYYIQNIKDTFNKKLNPPVCFFHEVRMEEAREKREIETDDVAQHYINLKKMYEAVYEEMTKGTVNNHHTMNDNVLSDCDDVESNFNNNNDKYNYNHNPDYYDEYYNMYDSDCYTEYDCYSDGYSDEYEYE
jgi:membrane-associated HD superfamily phosphohydrolase